MMKRKKHITEACGLTESVRDKNIIKRCLVLGRTSKNGRVYPIEVMQKALHMYEGAKVYLDHNLKGEHRSIKNLFGRIVNPVLEDTGIVGDLEYIEEHEYANTFSYMVDNMPNLFGLSHSATARTEMLPDGTEKVVDIVDVESVDIVSNPATNSSLLESYTLLMENIMKKVDEGTGMLSAGPGNVTPAHLPEGEMCDDKSKMKEEMGKILSNESLGYEGKLEALANLFPAKEGMDDKKEEGMDDKKDEAKEDCWDGYKKVPGKKAGEPGSCAKESDDDDKKHEGEDEMAESEDDKKKAEESIKSGKNVGLKLLLEELDSYRTNEKLATLKNDIMAFCKEEGLNSKLVTEAFVDVLMCSPQKKWKNLVEDRKKIATTNRVAPISVSGSVANGSGELTVDSLMKTLRS